MGAKKKQENPPVAFNPLLPHLEACAATVLFKEIKTASPTKADRWISALESKARIIKAGKTIPSNKSKQRVIRRIALDPIDRSAALVTSKSKD